MRFREPYTRSANAGRLRPGRHRWSIHCNATCDSSHNPTARVSFDNQDHSLLRVHACAGHDLRHECLDKHAESVSGFLHVAYYSNRSARGPGATVGDTVKKFREVSSPRAGRVCLQIALRLCRVDDLSAGGRTFESKIARKHASSSIDTVSQVRDGSLAPAAKSRNALTLHRRSERRPETDGCEQNSNDVHRCPTEHMRP